MRTDGLRPLRDGGGGIEEQVAKKGSKPPRPSPAGRKRGGQPSEQKAERLQKILARAGFGSRRKCEELITEGEGIQETQHEDILVLNCENGSCLSEINKQIEELVRLAGACDAEGIKKALKRIVPEYTPWTSQGEIVQSVSTECPAPPRLFQAEVVSETGKTGETGETSETRGRE